LLRVPIYVTKCLFLNEHHINHKICQIVIRRPDIGAKFRPSLVPTWCRLGTKLLPTWYQLSTNLVPKAYTADMYIYIYTCIYKEREREREREREFVCVSVVISDVVFIVHRKRSCFQAVVVAADKVGTNVVPRSYQIGTKFTAGTFQSPTPTKSTNIQHLCITN